MERREIARWLALVAGLLSSFAGGWAVAGLVEPEPFHDLELVDAKDYPTTPAELAACEKSYDHGCLEAHAKVEQARRRLFAHGRARALELTRRARRGCPDPRTWNPTLDSEEAHCRAVGAAARLFSPEEIMK